MQTCSTLAHNNYYLVKSKTMIAAILLKKENKSCSLVLFLAISVLRLFIKTKFVFNTQVLLLLNREIEINGTARYLRIFVVDSSHVTKSLVASNVPVLQIRLIQQYKPLIKSGYSSLHSTPNNTTLLHQAPANMAPGGMRAHLGWWPNRQGRSQCKLWWQIILFKHDTSKLAAISSLVTGAILMGPFGGHHVWISRINPHCQHIILTRAGGWFSAQSSTSVSSERSRLLLSACNLERICLGV